MTQKEKENRIHSFALGFLGKQQIVPNLYADQIIRGYKEGYLQAEQDLEAKEKNEGMIEALRTEYEKGRADVIADTLSWLANVWPQYCSNPNIIKAFEENVIKD